MIVTRDRNNNNNKTYDPIIDNMPIDPINSIFIMNKIAIRTKKLAVVTLIG